MTADSGTLRTSSRGGGANRARYLAGCAFSLGGQAGQQVQTCRPSTSTAIGSPIEPSLAPVTGQAFCSSTVGDFATSGTGGASLARYFAGSAFSFGGQTSQQVQTFRPPTSTAIGGPIVPSSASVTGQVFCASAVRLASRPTP